MNRAPLSLLAVAVALTAVTGVASLRPGEGEAAPVADRAPVPVERTVLTCPRPTGAESGSTVYTAYTPPTDGAAERDGDDGEDAGPSAALLPAPEYLPGDEEGGGAAGGGEAEPVVPLTEPGTPVSARVDDADAPALSGTAERELAPGWTVQQTTVVGSGPGSGVLGTACQAPDTEFWFAGASTAESRSDYLHITNPDRAATVVDIVLHGAEGPLDSEAGQGLTVPGGASLPVRLSTVSPEPQTNVAVQVTARTGRIGAQIEAVDQQLGADWLAPAAAPAGGPAVLPGIPAGTRSVRLAVYAPGDEDVTLDVGLAGSGGTITPAGYEAITVPAGTLTAIDLENVTRGEPGSLVLTPAEGSGDGRVVAAARLTIGEEDEQEMAFVQATGPVGTRASAAGNTASGTTLSLFAPGDAVEVEVTWSAGAEGGESVSETHTIDGRTTLTLTPELPEGAEGPFAVTLTPRGGTLYAARTLAVDEDGTAGWTVQTLPDDRSTVAVPETAPDLSILMD
ncbi:DUF5719 family protein [Streptomyces marincola]|uniref:Secreted protein n=1 Tax=Streptomyces marincola TaxID=2878388 RepID=A0A1W7D091_9ACTN|nr:DUF5719 family protein [Streptomyces marincola]ARQ70377.1 hypothetical protein CAG99_17375 [Streptomyces marincola]